MTLRSRDIARPGFTKSSEPKKVTRVCRSTRRTASIARPATSRIRRRISIGWCLKVAVGRIILTCSAVALMALGAPLSAAAVQQDFGAWRAYMRGRAAISQDKLGEAVRQFQTALQASEHDRILRQRTFGLALLSGDEKLSFELARALERAGQSGFDNRLVLLAHTVQDKRSEERRVGKEWVIRVELGGRGNI